MKYFISLFFLISCATFKSNTDYKVIEDISYTKEHNVERIVGDLYLPAKNNAPVMILVHGGGWESRHKGDMNHIAKSLASHGYAVFNINYRLAPKYQHPKAVKDLHSALKYIKSVAEKYSLDTKRIGLWGYSSGGHTVSYYALKYPDSIKVVVSGGAPYDLFVYPSSGYVKGYLGKYRDQMPERYKEASPINHIKSNSPRFFLYHAKSDNLVEYDQMINFAKKLKEYNVPHKTHTVSFWGHAMTFIVSKESIKKGIKYLEKNL